jgi:hypothetical protein
MSNGVGLNIIEQFKRRFLTCAKMQSGIFNLANN